MHDKRDRDETARLLLFALLMVLLILFSVGCIEDPAVKQELAGLLNHARVSKNEAAKAYADARRIRSEIRAIRDAVSAGDISPELAAEKAGTLSRLLFEAQEAAGLAANEAKDAYKKAAAIHKEHGVPWWKIGGELATVIVGSYGGWGALFGAAFGIWRLLKEKRYREAGDQAIGILTDAIESTGKGSPAKLAVKKAADPLIEEHVRGRQAEFESRKTNGVAPLGAKKK